ncbi:MAG: helix-turn-helix domain-containing protein [Treponema sp.]|nr:helix-turn-helix domain-containing protein [Treponema sp.]MBQ2551340.1 helix-turn-helix domain-containing protein [Treponema sp.]MBQ4237083.1 helix-turn-helix domain-containing protein [Treponema sp.]MBQ5384198.1 helix-turn-helix domain-containing protein [Treponema sp.]
MDSYGQQLKASREEQDLTIEDVEAKTSITRQYIEALENEENDVFPGEPYMIGFLKNYAEFLGLNPNEILKLYQAKKIQESPIPVELLQKKKPKMLVPIIAGVIFLILVGIGIYLYFFIHKMNLQKAENERLLAETKKIHKYEFSGTPKEIRMYKGDQIIVPGKEGDGEIVLTVKGVLGDLTLETPAGSQIVALGEERVLDIDGDSVSDLIVYLSDVATNDENRGAQVRLLLDDNTVVADVEDTGTPVAETKEPDYIPVTAANANQNVIHEDTRPYPFTLTVTFRGSCLFRYKIDYGEKIENHYTASSSSIPLQAQNGIRLWTSNMNSLSLQITAGTKIIDLGIGSDGHVEVEDIKWVHGNDGKYRLVVEAVD